MIGHQWSYTSHDMIFGSFLTPWSWSVSRTCTIEKTKGYIVSMGYGDDASMLYHMYTSSQAWFECGIISKVAWDLGIKYSKLRVETVIGTKVTFIVVYPDELLCQYMYSFAMPWPARITSVADQDVELKIVTNGAFTLRYKMAPKFRPKGPQRPALKATRPAHPTCYVK